MKCYVYKSLEKPDMYLYLGRKDGFDVVPDKMMDLFGKPQQVLEFELVEGRTLAHVDSAQVVAKLNERGYYLQMSSFTAIQPVRKQDTNESP